MDPDVLLDKARSTVDAWLEWSNGLGLFRQWQEEEAEHRFNRELEQLRGGG